MFSNPVYDFYLALFVFLVLLGLCIYVYYPRRTEIKSIPGQTDDLRVIEGIGPKIEQLLNKNGIKSYATLGGMKSKDIKKILEDAGPKFQMHDPSTWPKQAKLAAKGKWENLEDYKEFLIGGKDHI